MKGRTEEKYIGIFDSGVGGLTVLHQAMEMMPHERFLYYADSANVPYGTKSKSQILEFVDVAVDNMLRYPLKAIVLACNTATSVSAASLRLKHDIPIIGMEPAVKPAILDGDPRKILVFATELTLLEKKYKDLIHKLDIKERIDALPMQELVDFAEEFDFEGPSLKRYLRKTFANIKWEDYHSVVLGCTHFLYFKTMLSSFIPGHIQFVDGHHGTLKQLDKNIERNAFGTESEILCMLSGVDVATEVLGPYLNFLKGQRTRMFSSLS